MTQQSARAGSAPRPEEERHRARELAEAERRIAGRVRPGDQGYWLLGAIFTHLVAIALPFVTGVAGWRVLLLSPAAAEAHVKITEYVHAIVAFLGVVVVGVATLLLRRAWLALTGWGLTVVALFFAVLAIWLRRTRPGSEEAIAGGVGMYLGVLTVAVALAAYAVMALHRDEGQRAIAARRAQAGPSDAVSRLQAGMLERQRSAAEAAGEPQRDDRRARAARRHARLRDAGGSREADAAPPADRGKGTPGAGGARA